MKERPILFSAPMVCAILESGKTVTRRPVKATKAHADGFIMLDHGKGLLPYNMFGDSEVDSDGMEYPIACPYGQPGDRLWVRETWAQPANLDPGPTVYRATYPDCIKGQGWENLPSIHDIKWKPSIHMFRRDSRILLEVTAVRVERLHDIDEDQAQAEGIGDHEFGCMQPYDQDGAPECDCCSISYEESFQRLWETINGADAWSANPWVWVIEFKRVKQ